MEILVKLSPRREESMKQRRTISPFLVAAGVLIAMSSAAVSGEPDKESAAAGRILFLDLKAGRVVLANPDGADLKVAERKFF